MLRFTVTLKVQPEAARGLTTSLRQSEGEKMARAIEPDLQRLDQLRLSQRQWLDRLDRRQETHESRLQRVEARMSRWAGGWTALGAAGSAAIGFLVSVIKAHWPS